MRNKDYALTPAISAILAALIVSSTIGTIIVWGVPYTNSLNSEATKENVVSQMADISNQIKDLTGSSPGDKKASTYAFGGGSLSVNDEYDRTVVMYSHDPNYEFTVTDIGENSIIFKMLKPSSYDLNDAEVGWSTCFLTGTKVLMADGSHKNIEEVTVGELVLSYDETSGMLRSGRVSRIFHHASIEMPEYYLIINGGLKVTPNHRFYSDDRWVYAGDLKIGHKLFSEDKSSCYVYSIERVYVKEPCFDLEIEQYHTYFVSLSDADVLVHNPTEGGGENLPPSEPINPEPVNHAVGVPVNVILRWSECRDPEGGMVFYEIYFGAKGDMDLETLQLQEETWFDPPGDLNYNAEYWWKVIAYDEQGAYNESEMWDFTTESNPNNPPNIPIYSSPTNMSTGINITPTLKWNCSDPDGDPLTYNIYFGTTNPPVLIKSNWPVNNYAVGTLQYNTTYYWRIVANDGKGGSTSGPTWRFTTIPTTNHPPNIPTTVWPNDNETNVEIDLGPLGDTLVWSVNDPDSDLVDCDIYFGTSNPPPLHKAHDPSCYSYDIINDTGLLQYNTTYYWKITARDEHGATTTGPIWDFTTEINKSITIISPNGGEIWRNDTTQYITWSSVGVNENVKIELLGDDAFSEVLAVVPNTGSYEWDIGENPVSGVPPNVYIIRISSTSDWTIRDESQNFFYIYGSGSSILTLPAENVTCESATLVGRLENFSGWIQFRYRENGTTEWTYPIDYYGQYYDLTSVTFKETINNLLVGVKYEFQAGIRVDWYEIWGFTNYFTTYLHEGFANQITIPKDNISYIAGEDAWSIELPVNVHGTFVIDLYADGKRFGTIWIFDSNSLVYTRTDRDITDSYVLEKNGILSYLGGEWFVENNPQIYSSSNLFSINVVRTLFSFFSKSVSSSDMLKFKLYSTLQSSYIGDTKQVYNLRVQFNGDYANEWSDYLKAECPFFVLDNEQTNYASLKYINPEDPYNNGINLALAHSIVNLRLEP